MARPAATTILILALRALLVTGAAALAGCEEEQLIPGRCDDDNDCQSDQFCAQSGPNFHRCLMGDGGLGDGGPSDGRGADGPADLPVTGSDAAGDLPETASDHPDVPQDLGPTPCATAAECKDPVRPFCQAGLCVGCQASDAGTCSGALPFCDPVSGACVACATNAQCSDPTLPMCVANQCVSCAAGGGDPACKLSDPTKPLCAASGRCAECATSAQCQADPGKVFCLAEACVGCQLAPSNPCSGATPFCNASNGACAECVADADCPQAAAPFCAGNRCVACGLVAPDKCATLKPATPACGPTGACVECTSSADCTLDPARPVCNVTTQVCRACAADSECAARGPNDPGICLDNRGGTCATEAEVIVVTNTAGCGTTLGTRATPLCLPQDAATLFAPNRAVVAIHGTVPGLAWTLSANTPPLTVVGKENAVIAGGAQSSISLTGPAEVLIRGITVRSCDVVGVVASGGTTLRLRDSTIEGNRGGGILLDGAHFEIRNTTVADNGPGLTGTTSWGGILAQGITGLPATLSNVSIKTNKQVGLACAGPITGTAVYAKDNVGGIDVQSTCAITTCDPESATCGAGAM